jgi:hypothetical protein
MSGQRLYRIGSVRPAEEFPGGKPFLTTPKALPIIYKNFHRGGATVAEYKQISGERILGKLLTAYPGQPIDALAEIHRLDRQQDPHLGCDLNHCAAPHSPRSVSSSCPTPEPFNLRVMRVPRRPFLTFRWHSL